MKVAASNKQSGGLFVASESRAHQARPGSMRSEAEADGESCHPDQKVLTDKVRTLFFCNTFFHRGVTPILTQNFNGRLENFAVTPLDDSRLCHSAALPYNKCCVMTIPTTITEKSVVFFCNNACGENCIAEKI